MKSKHEFRDPIHGFISCTSMEREVINSLPFQRLRYIHQLAMTFFVYPGATHRRFEHSLGVMELASKVFSVVTERENIRHLPDRVLKSIPEINEYGQQANWESTLRMAALFHDVGHLPFSHGAEKLLPKGYTHERMTWEIINSPYMNGYWQKMCLDPKKIGKLALGQKDLPEGEEDLTMWENLLAEIIVGDAFGVDRMDYLLRDSHHLGVSYGHFDIKRLIHGLRIGWKPSEGEREEDVSAEPFIGIEQGSLQVAASLLWARYSIFSQVYFHHVRRIYDIHLQDFITACFSEGYPIKLNEFLALTDNEVLAMLRRASLETSACGHEFAVLIEQRKHFRCVYRQSHSDRTVNMNAADVLYKAVCEQFPPEKLRLDKGSKKHKNIDFPVINENQPEQMMSASQELPSINLVPDVETGYIFAALDIRDSVEKYLKSHKDRILAG